MTKAIILSGGIGSRLYPLTEDMPKPLVPIVNKAVISHVMKGLYDNGVRFAAIMLGHGADEIKRYISENGSEGLEIKYFKEDVPLGTAGAAALARGEFDDDFVLSGGDTMFDLDIGGAINAHKKSGAVATMIVSHISDPCMFGSVTVEQNGAVTGFVEKPVWRDVRGDMISSGVYILSPRIFELVPRGTFCDFAKDIFPRLVGCGLYAYCDDGYFCDVGTPFSYLRANMDACGGKSVISPLATVSKKADVRGSVIMDGAVVMDDAAVIDSVICRKAVIERGAVAERAVVRAGERIEQNCTATKNDNIDANIRIRAARLIRRERMRASGEFSAEIAPFDRLKKCTVIGRALAPHGSARTIGELIKRGCAADDGGVTLLYDGGSATVCCVGEDEMEVTVRSDTSARAEKLFEFTIKGIKDLF